MENEKSLSLRRSITHAIEDYLGDYNGEEIQVKNGYQDTVVPGLTEKIIQALENNTNNRLTELLSEIKRQLKISLVEIKNEINLASRASGNFTYHTDRRDILQGLIAFNKKEEREQC